MFYTRVGQLFSIIACCVTIPHFTLYYIIVTVRCYDVLHDYSVLIQFCIGLVRRAIKMDTVYYVQKIQKIQQLEHDQLPLFPLPYSHCSALLHDHSWSCELKLTTFYYIVTKS